MILVTGGTGFLGAYIIKHLVTKGYDVRAIRRENSKLPFFISPDLLTKVDWVDGDILDIISLEEAMVHERIDDRPAAEQAPRRSRWIGSWPP